MGIVDTQNALEILLEFQEPFFDILKTAISFGTFESNQNTKSCKKLPVVLSNDTFIDEFFEQDPSISYRINIDIRVLTLKENVYQLHLQCSYLAKSNLFTDFRVRLLELSIQLIFLALRIYEG